MGIRLDHDEFALVHAGHQMRQESAPVVAIETTPGWDGGDECTEQVQVRCLKCNETSEPFSLPTQRVTVAQP